MPNARLMTDNLADRMTLTAATESGLHLVGNLIKSKKSKVYRATATTVVITGVLAVAEAAAMVALPFCNLSPTATIRVRLYSDSAGVTLVRDTGVVLACPQPQSNCVVGLRRNQPVPIHMVAVHMPAYGLLKQHSCVW